jgi:uncharacterized protein
MDFNSELPGFSDRCRLFPLPDVLLFPHALLPLHILEPCYRQILGSDDTASRFPPHFSVN